MAAKRFRSRVLVQYGPPLRIDADEAPDVAWSLPLGAARLARTHFRDGAPGGRQQVQDDRDTPVREIMSRSVMC